MKTCSLSKKWLLENKFNGNEDEYKQYKSTLGKLSLKEKRPNQLKYWTNLGYTILEAKEKVSFVQKQRSPRCIEYWIKRGFSNEEAKMKISEHQDICSLKSFIRRWGESEGKIKYEIYKNKIAASTVFKDSSFQIEMSRKTKKSIEYWLKAGYSIEEAEKLRYAFCCLKSYWCKEYWMDRGYSEEESINQASKIQKDFSKKGLQSFFNRNCRSKIEIQFADFLSRYFTIYVDAVVETNSGMKFPDIYIEELDCFVEIYGDFWHAKNLDDNTFIIGNLTAADIRLRDKTRLLEIKEKTNKPILVIWESDLLKNGFDKTTQTIKESVRENKNH